MTQSNAPARRRIRGRWVLLGLVALLMICGGFEWFASTLAHSMANNAGDVVGGVNGAVRFDDKAQHAVRSTSYRSALLMIHLWTICPLMILGIALVAILSITKRRRVAPAPKPTSES